MGAALLLDVILTLPACSWKFDSSLVRFVCLSLSMYLSVYQAVGWDQLLNLVFTAKDIRPRCSKNTANLQRQCFASATQQHQEEWRYGGLKWLGFWKKNIQETYGNIWKTHLVLHPRYWEFPLNVLQLTKFLDWNVEYCLPNQVYKQGVQCDFSAELPWHRPSPSFSASPSTSTRTSDSAWQSGCRLPLDWFCIDIIHFFDDTIYINVPTLQSSYHLLKWFDIVTCWICGMFGPLTLDKTSLPGGMQSPSWPASLGWDHHRTVTIGSWDMLGLSLFSGKWWLWYIYPIINHPKKVASFIIRQANLGFQTTPSDTFWTLFNALWFLVT